MDVSLGGEMEESAGASDAIVKLLPACVLAMFLLSVWQFGSLRNSLIIWASIPFVTVGVALALKLYGTTLTFIGTLGLLALAGIIANNAVLMLDACRRRPGTLIDGARTYHRMAQRSARHAGGRAEALQASARPAGTGRVAAE